MTPIRCIQQATASYYEIDLDDILSPSRRVVFAQPRQLAMWIARERFEFSLPDIAHAFKRDHTTIMHAVDKVRERLNGPDGVLLMSGAYHIAKDAIKMHRAVRSKAEEHVAKMAEADFTRASFFENAKEGE